MHIHEDDFRGECQKHPAQGASGVYLDMFGPWMVVFGHVWPHSIILLVVDVEMFTFDYRPMAFQKHFGHAQSNDCVGVDFSSKYINFVSLVSVGYRFHF